MADPESIGALSEALVGELLAAGKTVSTAESCTGGWIAKSLTDNSGSSGCFGKDELAKAKREGEIVITRAIEVGDGQSRVTRGDVYA